MWSRGGHPIARPAFGSPMRMPRRTAGPDAQAVADMLRRKGMAALIAKPKRRNRHPEQDLQETVAKFLDIALDRRVIWWTALANGAHLTKREQTKLKKAGRRPGSLDLVFIPLVEVEGEDDHAHAGLSHWIEMKASDGKVSVDQRPVLAALGDLGAVCRSLPEVVAQLERWGFPLKARL
jgi:hypothetical protein